MLYFFRVDRVAKELKGQRQWSEKWKCLNDPKLYQGERAGSVYPQKIKPTKWSAFSVINPPGRYPVEDPLLQNGSLHTPYFKITGDRNRYLSSSRTEAAAHSGAYRHQQQRHQHLLHQHHQACAYQTAPFATDTPVDLNAVSLLQKHQPASLRMFNSSLVGACAGTRAQFAQDPQKVYAFPPTSSMEYGWIHGSQSRIKD
ncbi:hypothetical protein BSLG_003588 [Batrachochytrium salamandrivorans]|nr:hypothetical protein BSLG_003588 [Batrachochytrium salamandrivorans]